MKVLRDYSMTQYHFFYFILLKECLMQVTEQIHTLHIPFTIPVSPEKNIDRSVYVTLVIAEDITLIDTGVKGTQKRIFDYLEKVGRKPGEIRTLILSHSHPDHIGSAKPICEQTGCRVLAHSREREWIENTEKQKAERPVPGFDKLVGGPVPVDGLLDDGETLATGRNSCCRILHTPGHSGGSVSLHFPEERVLFTGDSLPVPGDLPIYDDIAESLDSIKKINRIAGEVDVLLSSWEEPVLGREKILQRIREGAEYLKHIHDTVIRAHRKNGEKGLPLCGRVVAELGLPTFAANPLVARAFMSSLSAADRSDIFQV